MQRCPECSSSLALSGQKKEVICRNCGLVIDDEYLIHDSFLCDSQRKHAQVPGLATAGTKGLDGKIFKKSWVQNARDRNLSHAQRRIDLLASKHNLPKHVTTEAMILYSRAVDLGLNIGRDNLSILYACVYASCLIHGIPKTPLELTAFSEVSRFKMLKSYKLLKENLELSIKPPDPVDLVHRFGSRLKLRNDTINFAADIITNVKDTPVVAGGRPETIVACAIYLACHLNNDYRTQREIANKVGVIEVTIRKISGRILSLTKIIYRNKVLLGHENST